VTKEVVMGVGIGDGGTWRVVDKGKWNERRTIPLSPKVGENV
jgi:hypothetical protein